MPPPRPDHTRPRSPWGGPRSPWGWLALALGGLYALTQSALFVGRAFRDPRFDFGVFYRSAQALAHGLPPGFYATPDAPSGGPYCLPPAGTMLFCYMPQMSVGAAAVIWALVNLLLVAACGWCLWRIFTRLERHRRVHQGTWFVAMLVLMVLAGENLQMGQLSLLITTCWLAVLAAERGFWAATALAFPAALKVYPALLWGLPVLLRRSRELLWLVPALLLVAVILPLLAYGPTLPDMYADFAREMILGARRLHEMQDPTRLSNEGLDVLARRYLTVQPAFDAAFPRFPHLALPPSAAAAIVSVLRLLLLAAAGVVAWRLGAGASRWPRWTALLMMALGTATLYLVMPEAKSRYAVYLLPAFLPLLATAATYARPRWRAFARWGLLALIIAAVIQVEPSSLRPYGASLVATSALWLLVVRLCWRAVAPAAPKRTPAALTPESS